MANLGFAMTCLPCEAWIRVNDGFQTECFDVFFFFSASIGLSTPGLRLSARPRICAIPSTMDPMTGDWSNSLWCPVMALGLLLLYHSNLLNPGTMPKVVMARLAGAVVA